MSNTTVIDRSKEKTKTDPKVDARVRDKLVTARVALLLKAPFFGNLATRFKIINADDWCPTAATDGRHFYYNSQFVDMLSLRETEFLFGHEVLHAVYDHMGRRGDREPRLWNIADDYCVNADLIKYKIGEKITKVGCLYDPKFADKSAEEVYDYLFENAEKINIEELAKQLLDEHMDGDGDGEGEGSDGDKDGKGRPRLSELLRICAGRLQPVRSRCRRNHSARAAHVTGSLSMALTAPRRNRPPLRNHGTFNLGTPWGSDPS